MVCFTLEVWGFNSDWHPLFQIPNSSPAFPPSKNHPFYSMTFKCSCQGQPLKCNFYLLMYSCQNNGKMAILSNMSNYRNSFYPAVGLANFSCSHWHSAFSRIFKIWNFKALTFKCNCQGQPLILALKLNLPCPGTDGGCTRRSIENFATISY